MRSDPEYRLVVAKAARRLRLYAGDVLLEEFIVAIGRNALADKQVEGDEATPLGEFTICAKNPRSKYFLSLCLSYPGTAHARRGLAAGLISAYSNHPRRQRRGSVEAPFCSDRTRR